MRVVDLLLCVFLGCLVSASVIDRQDVMLSHTFPGFFPDFEPLPFEGNFDFTPHDSIFSSWRSPVPDFHMHAQLPPMMNVPRIQVFCDESRLSVLVDKRINGAMLTAEEVQLGNGCYSNGERANQVVFTYNVDECGTTHKMQNGLVMFTNSVHLNMKKPLPAWRQTPSTVHVSCIPERSLFTAVSSEGGRTFDIKAMNSSWTSAAVSDVYKRGQVVNLQVSANTGRGEQLFIQSCFVSASPDPQSKPRHAVIMNKGCTAALGSPHPVVQFVASGRGDVVNFVLNTTYLMAEIYIHCTALISNQGITAGSKSCNYNFIKSRWEDLSGDDEVCKCCSSRCKGRPHHEGFRATVSTGPFVTVDNDVKTSSTPDVSSEQQLPPPPVTDSMQSDAAVTETLVSGASLSRSKFSSPLQGDVFAIQDPVSSLILLLPGQMEDRTNDGSDTELKERSVTLNDIPEQQPSSYLNLPLGGINVQNEFKSISFLDLNFPSVDGWPIPAPDKAESRRLNRFGRSGVLTVDVLLPAEMTPNDLNFDLNLREEEPTRMQAEAAEKSSEQPADDGPIIRSKLQFSKSADGTQTLSYEEEEVAPKKLEVKPATMRRAMAMREGQKGLRSAFLDFLRRMDKAE